MFFKLLRKNKIVLLRLTGILIFVFILIKIDFSQLIDHLKKVNILYFIIVIFLNIPFVFIKALRWNYILRIQKIHLPIIESTLIYSGAAYIGTVTPGRIGEFTKTIYLTQERGVSLTKGTLSVLADRFFDLHFLMILGALGLWKLKSMEDLSDSLYIIIIAMLFFPILLLNRRIQEKILKVFQKSTLLKNKRIFKEETLDHLCREISYLPYGTKLILPGILTVLSYFIFFFQWYLLAIGFNLRIDFVTISLFASLSNLIAFIPLSISGLGTRDAALIYLFSIIGYKPEIALSYSVGVFIALCVFGGLNGMVALLIKPSRA